MDASAWLGMVYLAKRLSAVSCGVVDEGWLSKPNFLAVDLAVDPAVADSARIYVSAGQGMRASLARNADFFPHHGRQAILGNSAPQALDIHHPLASPALWWVTTAVVALTIAVFALHRHLRSHHLRSRVRYDLLPTATFEPSMPGVVGFAHQLGRVRPVHGWVPKSAVGVRIGFSTDDQFGKMTMSVEGRKAITGVINKLVYPQVEIRRSSPAVETGQGETAPVGEGEVSSVANERAR